MTESNKNYVVVTTISTHRIRYCISVDELQKSNTEIQIEGHECEWAEDCVTMNEVGEFSQSHLGEQIVDSEIVTEEAMLKLFDKDNDYLRGWTQEKKIEWVGKNDKKYMGNL